MFLYNAFELHKPLIVTFNKRPKYYDMKIIERIIKIVENAIIISLIIFMAIVLIFSTLELGVLLFDDIVNRMHKTGTVINVNELVQIFGVFLNVLIGIELFETVKLYLKENVFHGEVILIVGLIAISRKVIILDYSNEDPFTIMAMALLIAAMTLGYFLIKKSRSKDKEDSKPIVHN